MLINFLELGFLQGGVHLSNPSFLPNALLKELTATTNTLNLTKFFNLNHKLEELDRQQELLHALANHENWKKRTVPVSSVKDLVAELPWWLKCNPHRCFLSDVSLCSILLQVPILARLARSKEQAAPGSDASQKCLRRF